MKISEIHCKNTWTIHSAVASVLVIACLLFSQQTLAEFRHFGDWTTKEKSLYTAYNLVSYVDYQQTIAALKHPCGCYRESNPLFGKYPSKDKLMLTQAAVAGIIYYSIGKNPEGRLNRTMMYGIAVRSYIVYHNNEVGLSWKVAF